MSDDRIVQAAIAALTCQADTACEYHVAAARAVLSAVEPLIRDQIAQRIEDEWGEECAGKRNTEACESCRAYSSAARIAKEGH